MSKSLNLAKKQNNEAQKYPELKRTTVSERLDPYVTHRLMLMTKGEFVLEDYHVKKQTPKS